MSVGVSSPDPDAHLLNIVARCYAEGAALGVMVSGGGDSMALLHLLHRLAAPQGLRIEATTIDHGLRAGARAEAEMVAAFCSTRGIPHQISLWQHGKIAGNLMDEARRARYQMAEAWAVARGLTQIAVGHTADDQAETFLIGLSRQAGIDGLSGMRKVWGQGGLTFTRPLLSIPREDLRDYLRRHGIQWADDPSNADSQYTRVKARNALATLAPLGITATVLAAVSDNLETARQALVQQVQTAAQSVSQTGAGTLRIPRAGFLHQPQEIQRRLLITALRWISGAGYPPRESGLMAVQTAIAAQKDATLGGVRFKTKADTIYILREAKAVQSLACPTTQLWDNRWQMSGPHAANLTIRALGADGLSLCGDWRSLGIPRDALLVTPAVWQDQTLIAAPIAGFSNGWQAFPAVSFGSFVLSH
ncbi:MAG: tRNA lysidine(34) synthetase TilS [Cypionkella sp.]|uniref:tRNA lysidine(34) synthetase TilS n=1 Tax=Cypionkella sp. TaxID=2811411 RepID=UPI002ABCB7AD|nr:tRNA lysidine(34) synthetase TilS [Cypionkella sp.]MDZ4311322.1 tRNA lysidine(34) synthetase TilS [Cypionkella sp.]MDZ4393654.1 tRNA lysidine(34) synthetase TilS [Cypionkella sp.]